MTCISQQIKAKLLQAAPHLKRTLGWQVEDALVATETLPVTEPTDKQQSKRQNEWTNQKVCDLTVVVWNCKRYSYENFLDLQEEIQEYDIIAVLETAETPSSLITEQPPDTFSFGFHAYTGRLPRWTTWGAVGGIRVFIKNKHQQHCSLWKEEPLEQYLWIQLHKPRQLYIAFCYFPTENSPLITDRFMMPVHKYDRLAGDLRTLSGCRRIVSGDLNACLMDLQSWADEKRFIRTAQDMSYVTKDVGERLLHILAEAGMVVPGMTTYEKARALYSSLLTALKKYGLAKRAAIINKPEKLFMDENSRQIRKIIQY